jgi:hypothetical protein
MSSYKHMLALAVAAAASVALTTVSRADTMTYVQTSDDCTGGCGTSSSNKVTISTTGTAGQIEISVSLASGFDFIHSGFPGSFGFGLSSGFSSISFSTGTTAWSTTGWTPAATPVSATSPQTINGASQSWDGSGTFSNGYAMTWNGGNGIGNEDGQTLDFFISGTGLTLASFAADTTGSFFTADVAGTGTTNGVRNTGIIDFTLQATPLPGAALLFGSVLFGGLGVSTWRRRRSGRSTISVLA